MPVTKCTVSDVLKDPEGALVTSTTLTFERIAALQSVEGDVLVTPTFGTDHDDIRTVVTDASTAAFSIDLYPGVYRLTYPGKGGAAASVSFAVPLAASATLNHLIGQATSIDSTLIQQALQAASDAADSEAAAAQSASDAATSESNAADSETAAATSATNAGNSETASANSAAAANTDADRAEDAADVAEGWAGAAPGLAQALEDALTSAALETTASVPVNERLHSPVPTAKLLVQPNIEGNDLDTPVVLNSVIVEGANIAPSDADFWEPGQINDSGGETGSTSTIRSGAIKIEPGQAYARSTSPAPVMTLYEADGTTFVRQITAVTGQPDTFVAAANERVVRLSPFVGAPSKGSDALENEIMLVGGVSAPEYQPYYKRAVSFGAVNLYAYGDVKDTIRGLNHTRRIERRTLRGTAESGKYNVSGTAALLGSDYYRMLVQDADDFLAGTHELLTGRSGDGDYAVNAAAATQARGIWSNRQSDVRIAIEKAKIDAMAGADATAKFIAYLDANEVEVIFDRGAFATATPVTAMLPVMPVGGSVRVDATGISDVPLRFREQAGGASGGASVETRVSANETAIGLIQSRLTAAEGQIENFVTQSGSAAETIAARSSAALGVNYDFLTDRLNAIESAHGINVKTMGAVGDDATDDTDAIRAAVTRAEALGVPVVIPYGNYLVRGTIPLRKSTEVIGYAGPWLKKIPAVSAPVIGAVTAGQTVFPVADASTFVVGRDVTVGVNETVPSYSNLLGVITEVNTVADTVTVEAYNNPLNTGALVDYADGEATICTTFPIISTNRYVTPGVKISPKISGIRFDSQRQVGETEGYTTANIHLDAAITTAPRVTDCYFHEPNADGISEQGDGDAVITGNIVIEPRVHGIHKGFTNYRDRIAFNYVLRAGVSGYFWCFSCVNGQVAFNAAEECDTAFFEIDTEDRDTTLSSNITINCDRDYYVTGSPGIVSITDFISVGNKDTVAQITNARRFSVTGIARAGEGTGVIAEGSIGGRVAVDWHDWSGPYCVDVRMQGANRSSKIRVSGLFNGGVNTIPVRIESADKIVLNDYIMDCGGAHDVLFVTKSGADAPDGCVIGAGVLNAGISGTSTNLTNLMA